MKLKEFNKAYANEISLDQFLKEHEHLGSKKELEDVYKELTKDKPKEDNKK